MTPVDLRPEEVDLGFVPRPADHVAWVELDGEAVLYDNRTASLTLLDPIATLVWSRFDGDRPLQALVADLETAFAAQDDRVRRDVLALTRDLGSKGLVAGVQRTDGPDESNALDDDRGDRR